MPTTFDVIFLGNFADVDTVAGNQTAENASALVGTTVGGIGNALANNIQTLSPGTGGGSNGYYDNDNSPSETFRIDGGPPQTFDFALAYNATITYLDGTTAQVSAVVFQDVDGNTYLAPEFSFNGDQQAYNANALLSISLDSVLGDTYSGMTDDRVSENSFVICYTEGALIETPLGPVSVERLRAGDMVRTRDKGAMPIRWIGAVTRDCEERFMPVRIKKGALGGGLPERDLVVSPQHRMLLRSKIAGRMFGTPEMLVAAKKLIGIPGIDLARDHERVTYVHFLLETHEIVFAEGAPSESLLAGPQARMALGQEEAAEIEALFPGLLDQTCAPALPIAQGRPVQTLISRHQRNSQPLLQF